jgi:hypothetical protein
VAAKVALQEGVAKLVDDNRDKYDNGPNQNIEGFGPPASAQTRSEKESYDPE